MERLIGLDTSVLIYLLEDHPLLADPAERIFRRIRDGGWWGVFSHIGMVELLTGVKKRKRPDLVNRYRELLLSIQHLYLRGTTLPIVEIASNLRATYNIKTADAIHIATSIASGADLFVTYDKRLTAIREIPVVMLDQL